MSSDAGPEIREPDGQEPAEEASAGDPRASGPAATREALASEEPFRLSEEELEERERGFTRPRKPQGPPLEGEGEPGAAAEEPGEEEVEETPPPEAPPGS
jgi:hypothetical protein